MTPLTLTAYAKLRGCSKKSVSRAIAAGRLVESVGRNERGQPTILDPELADREWEANTRQRADRPAVSRETSASGDLPDAAPGPASQNSPTTSEDAGAREPRARRADLPDGVPVYHVSQAVRAAAAARREAALADQAELDLAARRGRLVDADAARADVEQAYSLVKTRLLRVPSAVGQQLPDLALRVVPVLEALITEALQELSG